MKLDNSHIVLFDGQCNLCNGLVQFIIKRDPKAKFKFAALQSTVGKRLIQDVGLFEKGMDTIVLIQNGTAYLRSDAAWRIARELTGGWPAAYLLRFFPRCIRDAVYSFVAQRRYRWFGQQETCMTPTIDIASRFLAEGE